MLQQFTWEQFLWVAATLAAVWYISVLLLFFRKEIRGLFTPENKTNARPSDPGEPEDGEVFDLMGSTAMSEGVLDIAPDELTFSPKSDTDGKTRKLGLVSDFLQEIKELIDTIEREKGNKEDFHKLFDALKQKYPAIRESGRLETLASYLEDHLPFTLTDEEMQHLWD
ncbi:hypothetical protein GCM10011386_38520 [Parapedobacter defluvii]|uniref:Uncharacterized protein n=1 Tax=Parapedobacter defluvii TaxID=2045106 RepID=A0ABQ1MLX7_9SPHI|nr:hypothetical protein [Parapedobacter defluvii]GGC42572.1 hypothetical protein GCM10011386_38520 [Parapedobacter defluvii]